jgi:uncharacterized protein YjbJ (UPF0337 family)
MNRDIIQGHWHELKGKVRKQWANLTDDDLAHLNGTREELRGLLQKKYGFEKERVEKEIDKFIEQSGFHE